MARRVCVTGHIKDPVIYLSKRVGHRVTVVGFFLVSFVRNHHGRNMLWQIYFLVPMWPQMLAGRTPPPNPPLTHYHCNECCVVSGFGLFVIDGHKIDITVVH